ncbi:MAG: 50S ribosomal protein L25, partial [Deltaproteobacteria bacterium]|nr:50S ribosomal protein L25 [Deltaproteobacteria bacterium]
MDTFNLVAETRPAGSKGDARKIRKAGATPGVIYRAGAPAVAVKFDGAALSTIFRKTNDANTIINIDLGGKAHACLVREVQRHPVSRAVEHIDFYQVEPGQDVTVTVPVVTAGKAAGVRAGGLLRLLARRVQLSAPAGSIPRNVEVDVSALEVGRFIKASQLVAPAGTKILFAQDFNVVTVEGKKTEAAAEAAPAAA